MRAPLQSIPESGPFLARRLSIPNAALPSAPPKNIRTSKTSQKLVVLPSAPQTRPLAHETDHGEGEVPHEYKSEGERLNKEQRQRAGYKRLTAYCTAGGYRMKLLAAFLKREHGVQPRVYDEALYVMYHLPLLPGYQPNVNVRSSAPTQSPGGKSILSKMSEAEEHGYEGTYFTSSESPQAFSLTDGFIASSSPPLTRQEDSRPKREKKVETKEEDRVAEAIFFDYGVAVFFGLQAAEERDILEDLEKAGIWVRRRDEDDWEVEECHYVYDPTVASPRIYNDFFTFKSHSHLLKLSISHAIAQSTLLAHYESTAARVLSDPSTLSIPRQLALTGELTLRRRDALALTGKLFKLRQDVNLVSNVLDVPELFWSEASLGELYEAVRDYMEISQRVQVLNERLGVASDLLDIIHEHLNNGAMHRITWIIIWLIVVACLVELGEVVARLVVHAGTANKMKNITSILHSEDAQVVLARMMSRSGQFT